MIEMNERLSTIRRWSKDLIFEYLGIHNHLSSDRYVQKLRSNGCKIGDGTSFFGKKCLDLGNAHLITIGENCVVTDGVRILTHAWDRPVLSNIFEEVPEFSKMGKVTIGDNVFIGERTIILPDTEVGSNTIIGAGSVVTEDIPSGSVAAGNPCQVISSIEEYRDQRISQEYTDVQQFITQSRVRGVQTPNEMKEYTHSPPQG